MNYLKIDAGDKEMYVNMENVFFFAREGTKVVIRGAGAGISDEGIVYNEIKFEFATIDDAKEFAEELYSRVNTKKEGEDKNEEK